MAITYGPDPDEKTALYLRAVEKWGLPAQLDQLIEECGELIVTASHVRRGCVGKRKIADEIADVLIMIEDIVMVLEIEDDVELLFRGKLVRLKKRLENN